MSGTQFRLVAIALAIGGGLMSTFAASVLSEEYHAVGFYFGLWLVCVAVLIFLAYLPQVQYFAANSWPKIATISTGMAFVIAAGGWLVGSSENHETATPPRPEVTLRFIHPKGPALELVNQSDVLAREIKWTVVLWNVDTLSERTDPLPIPVQTFDWIRPNQKSGPRSLFSTPAVKSLLTSGNRLFGSASVICPDCVRGWTYMVFIKWGHGGWYSEVKDKVSGDLLIPTKATAEAVLAFVEAINRIPEKDRIPITDR